MALTKDKKKEIVSEIADLLDSSKMTVVAQYAGTSVRDMQQLRRDAKQAGVKIKVVKNRLFLKSLSGINKFSHIDSGELKGQLLYAFGNDEAAPAQILANFAKTQPQIKFKGAISYEGEFLDADEVATISKLPSKDQLRAQLMSVLNAPTSNFARVISGNISSLLNVLNAKADNISQ